MQNKIPQVTLAFWAIKICATTLGETGGDYLSMSLQLGYAISAIIFTGFFAVTLAAQVTVKSYHPFFYWAVILSTTTVGTAVSDYMDRTLGLGYVSGSLILSSLLIAVLLAWRFTTGSISIGRITTRKAEIFYWTAILVSNTLGTAFGDYLAELLGYQGGALLIGAILGVIALAYFFSQISHTILFWSAFVLTRPLGATLGDFLTKTHEQGGLHLDRLVSSLAIAAFVVAGILLTQRKSEQHPPPL